MDISCSINFYVLNKATQFIVLFVPSAENNSYFSHRQSRIYLFLLWKKQYLLFFSFLVYCFFLLRVHRIHFGNFTIHRCTLVMHGNHWLDAGSWFWRMTNAMSFTTNHQRRNHYINQHSLPSFRNYFHCRDNHRRKTLHICRNRNRNNS